MSPKRVAEYALMVLGPVRFSQKDTRSQTIHILKNMLDEEFGVQLKEERHPKLRTGDSVVIDGSQRFNAVELAKAGYLSPWKQKLVKVLGL